MYFQLKVTQKNTSVFLQALASLVEDLSNIKYKLEQLKEPNESLNKTYQFKNDTIAFLLFCLEKLQGHSLPVVLDIKQKLDGIIRIISGELKMSTFVNVEQKMSSLSLVGCAEFLMAEEEIRCKIFTTRLEKLREIEAVIEDLVLKAQRQEVSDNQAYIQFSFEEYLFYTNRFKAKSDFLDKFFGAFDCLGDKNVSFSGSLADSRCYLKKALLNAQRNLNQTLSEQDVSGRAMAPQEDAGGLRQQEVLQEPQMLQSEWSQEQQPMLIVSPSMKRSSASLNLLDLAEGGFEGDTPEVEQPPRSPSALRFL
ncbi:MAG: hypothetical protein HYX61_02325 [Gammaproteobacteria bacterium]|jgi:hypothetical protein|nr:hypothetical protein [Gammaproteobacteria bacterium]